MNKAEAKDKLIEVMRENETLRARVAALERIERAAQAWNNREWTKIELTEFEQGEEHASDMICLGLGPDGKEA